eukprot:COSAG02_NODE_3734_length_6311_cov_70.627173_9_plen_119_part_00
MAAVRCALLAQSVVCREKSVLTLKVTSHSDRLCVCFVCVVVLLRSQFVLRRSTAVGAASFWNYNSSWSFDGLTDRYLGFAAQLEARGLFTCPANCTLVKTADSNVGCDYNYACGKRYS